MTNKLKNRQVSVISFAGITLAVLCCVDTALAQSNTISVTPTALTFSTSMGTPQPQNVTVSSATNTAVGFSIGSVTSQSNWLSVFPSSGISLTTPATLQVGVLSVVSGLPNGSYTGSFVITPTSGTAVTVTATLNVGMGSTTSTFSASPPSLAFSTALGVASGSQTVTLSTTGATTTVNLTPSANWLQVPSTVLVGPGSPASFSVSANPGTLAAGTYSATINVTPAGAMTAALQINVTLSVGTGTGTGNFNASPGSMVFNAATPAAAVASQVLTVTTGSFTSEPVTVIPSTTTGTNWLQVNGSTGSSSIFVTQSLPGMLSVSVNPSLLATGTSYSGSIALQSQDFGTISIPVTLNVGTGSTTSNITASPNPLNVTIPTGSTVPANPTLSVTSTISQSVSAQVSGLSWLAINPTSLNLSSGTAGTFTVTVNPSGQSAGTYTASITLTPASGASIVVPVNVTIGSAPSLTVSPMSLSFAYQTGTASPQPQTISLTSSGSGVPFSISSTTQTGNGWLIVSPTTGATTGNGGAGSNINVSVNPAALSPGTYNGTITITSSGASNSSQSIPVMLVVGTQPVLQLGSSGLTFNYQYGSATQPSQQQVTVQSSGNPLLFTAAPAPGSGGNWVKVTPPNGTTPVTLNVSVDPTVLATLSPGTYAANITLTSASASNTTTNLPVTLIIGQSTLLNVSQTAMNFNYQITQAAPAIQTLMVNSTGAPLTYSATSSTTNCANTNFLSVTPASGSTPGMIAVQVPSTSGLTPGTCNGTITITSAGAANSPLTVPVTVQVSNSPLLNVSPGAISVTTQTGTSPANQTIALTSTDPTVALPFNVTSLTNSGGANWLLVGPTSGSTPNNLTIGFQTMGLAVGAYTGSITVTPTTSGVPPTVIPVTLTVSSSATAAVTPTSLTFSQAFNGPVPATQTISISSPTAGLSYSATATTLSGGNWLSVTSPNGTTPGMVTVTANGAGLNQGSYSGVVTFMVPNAANTPINIPVTLTVGPAQSLGATPTVLNFTYAAGATNGPATQNVQITSNSGAVPFTVTTTSTPSGLLSVNPSSGTTPGTVAVGFVQSVLSTLAAGNYSGTVTIAGGSAGSQTITVNLTVTAPPPPSLTTLVNSASGTPGAVSPGEIITIYGTNIGPSTPLGLQLINNGTGVATTLGSTQVLFDNVAAPLLYVSAGQINAIVPYEIAGRVTTNVVITRSGVSSSPLQQRVVDSAPGIFSANQTGNGPGAILNADSSANTGANAAAKGSVIQIFATGEGALNPQVTTGAVTGATAPFPKPAANVSVTIGGQPATIQYAGEAPSLVSGVLQVNAVIPSGIGSGPQTVVLNVGSGTNSQQTITVAVQ